MSEDINVQGYLDTVNAPWGKLFYKLVWHNIDCEGKKILDFGSGFGITADYFAKSNDVTAIEPNDEMLKHRFCNNEYSQIAGGIEKIRKKDKLTKKYTFLDKKVISKFDESKYYISEYEFSINSYIFNVIAEDGKHNMQFPHSFSMIGTSDKKKSIAYLYFYDTDLDYIGEKNIKNPMANFVKEYFDYDF